MPLKPTYIDPDNPSQLREPRANDTFINEPDVSFDTISDLTDYKIDQSPRTKTANVMGYYSAGDGGGGTFYWDSSEDKANHNGGTIINPDHNSTIGSENWYSASGDSTDTSGSGCWVRPVSKFVTPEMYGARGDGQTKDTEAFQQMLKDYGNIYLTQHYYLDAISGTRDNYNIIGNGKAKLDFSNVTDTSYSNSADFLLEGSNGQISDLSSDLSKNDTQVSFSSAHNLSKGDLFTIYNPTDFSWSGWRNYYRKGEICKVKNVVNSTTVDVFNPLYDDYTAINVDVYKINPIEVHLEGFNVIGNDRYGIWGFFLKNSSFSNIDFEGIFKHCIQVDTFYGVNIDNINITQTDQASSEGYGIVYSSGQNITIENSTLDTYTDAIESGTSQNNNFPCRKLTINNVNSTEKISEHGNVEFSKIYNCNVLSVLVAGDHAVVEGCTVDKTISFRENIGFSFGFIDNTVLDKVQSSSIYGAKIYSSDGDNSNTKRGGKVKFIDNDLYGELRFNLGDVSGQDVELYLHGNIIRSDDSNFLAHVDIRGNSGADYNFISIKDNTIKTRLGTTHTNHYPHETIALDDINVERLEIEDNWLYGHAGIEPTNSPNNSIFLINNNKFIRPTESPRINGNGFSGDVCFVYFTNNLSMDNKRVDGASTILNTNVFFNNIGNLFIENNKLGDTVNNNNGDWIGLQRVDNVWLTNNSSINQDSKSINYDGGTSESNVKSGNTGLAHKRSGKATIPSGNNVVNVTLDNFFSDYSILLTGTHDEVSDCIVSSITSSAFSIRTGDGSNVTADRDVYWQIIK